MMMRLPEHCLRLADRYNVTNTNVYNLAYGGATTDSKLVTPYLPTVQYGPSTYVFAFAYLYFPQVLS